MRSTAQHPSESIMQFDLYNTSEYFELIKSRADKAAAGARILLTTMSLDPTEPAIEAAFESLEAAAGRQADVTLGIDAHSFLVHNGVLGPLWYRSKLPKRLPAVFQTKYAAMDKLNLPPDARAVILNKPGHAFSLPIAGRCHIKALIVNNYMAIGSANLENKDWVNLMVGMEDPGAADWLYGLLRAAADAGSVREALQGEDQEYKINAGSSLLMDAGALDQSIIFEQTLELIDSAEEWIYFPSQFFPNEVTGRHLQQAGKRGVKLEIPFSHPKHQGFLGGIGQQASIFLERIRLPDSMFQDALGADAPMLHTKLIACDKGVMIGSHNFVSAGVTLGTAEIAFRSSDVGLAQRAVESVKRGL